MNKTVKMDLVGLYYLVAWGKVCEHFKSIMTIKNGSFKNIVSSKVGYPLILGKL